MLLEFTIIKLRSQTSWNDSPILDSFKNIIFIGVGKPDFREGQVENRAKTGKLPNFPGIWGEIFPICPWNIQVPSILHLCLEITPI